MLTDSEQAYLALPADSRLEIRVPAVLKQHAELVASANFENLSQFVIAVLAKAVGERLAEVGSWKLTIPEQEQLLRILANPATQTQGMTAARKRTEQLFGPSALEE